MRRRSYRCPNCGAGVLTSKSLVLHLLEEAEHRGVTTADFMRAGVGSRYGGRLYELRHDDGYTITEERIDQSRSRYTLVTGRQQLTELRCQLGHAWVGTCRRDACGYPFVAGAVPVCPVCAREACAVETFMSPAHPDVVAKAAA